MRLRIGTVPVLSCRPHPKLLGGSLLINHPCLLSHVAAGCGSASVTLEWEAQEVPPIVNWDLPMRLCQNALFRALGRNIKKRTWRPDLEPYHFVCEL